MGELMEMARQRTRLKKLNAYPDSLMEEARLRAKYKKINTDGVDENYINQYLSDAQNYFKAISDPDESQYSAYRDLQQRRSVADAWLYKNRDSLELKSYADAYETLQTVGSAMDALNNEWSKFKTEDEWKKYVRAAKAEKAERDRKLNYDPTADLQEIARLNQMVDDFYASIDGRQGKDGAEYGKFVRSETQKLVDYFNQQYGDITTLEEIEDLIDSKQRKVDKLKQFQKYTKIPQAEDFEEYSLAGSNMADGTDFVYEVFGTPNGTDNYIEHYRKFYADNPSFQTDYGAGQVGNAASFALAMTDDEVKIYNYYLAKEGKEAASEYLKYIEKDVQQRILTGYANFANRHPVIASMNSVATSLGSGVELVWDVMKNKTGIDDEMDTNRLANITNLYRGTVSEKLSLKIGEWDAGKFLYNTAMSGADSAAAMLLPHKSGGIALGLSAAAQGVNDALERGMNSEQAFWNGLMAGTFEMLFESISIGNFKALKEVSPDTIMDAAKNVGKSMLTNASEEMLTEIANIAYDTIANGEFANYDLEELLSGKWQGAWKDVLGQIGESGLSGALMGAGFGITGSAVGYTSQKIDSYRLAEAISNGDVEGMQALLNQLKEVDPENKLAKRLQTKLNAGKLLSGKELVTVAKQITAATEGAEKKSRRGKGNSTQGNPNATESGSAVSESGSASAEGDRTIQEERRQEFEENLYREWGRNGTDFTSARAKLEEKGDAKIPSAEAYRIYTVAKNEAEAEVKAEQFKVTVTESGEDSSVVSVASVSGGKVTVELEGGRRVSISDIAFENPHTEVLYRGAATMNVASANAMIQGFDGDLDALDYVRGWQEAYNSARYGIDLSESRFASALTEEQLERATLAGKADRKRERGTVGEKRPERRKGTLYRETDTASLSKAQETAVEALDRLAKVLGVDIYLYSEADSRHRGWYDPADGSIHLNLAKELSAEGTLLFTAAHELTHYIRDYAPDKFGVLADFLLTQYGEHGISVSELVERQMEIAETDGRQIDYDTAFEEVIASSMETMLQSGNVVEAVAKLRANDATLWEKFAEYFRDLANRLRKAFQGLSPTSLEGRYVGAMKDAAERLEAMFTDALVTASGREKTKNTAEGGVKWATGEAERFNQTSIEQALWESFDHNDQGHDNLIRVSNMPNYIVEKFGIVGDIYIYRDHAYENMVTKDQAQREGRPTKRKGEDIHFHGLGIEKMTRALLAINDPMMVIQAKTKDGNPTVIMLLSEFGNNGAPLYAVLSFYSNREINGEFKTKPHIVLTVAERNYTEDGGGRIGYDQLIRNAVNEGRVLDFNEKKRADLSVIAKPAGLGNITKSSLEKSISRFRKEIKSFKEKNKILYSTDSTDVETLQADNAVLREDNYRLVQMLNLQRTIEGGTRFTEESVAAAADSLMKWAGATGRRGELIEMLHSFYEYIARGEKVDWDTLRQRSDPIVAWLTDHRKSAAETDPQVQDLKRYLRPLKVKLSDAQMRQVEALYGSYNEYRKQLFGTVNLSKDAGMTLEEVWGEMAELFPGMFDASQVDTDMPGVLLDVVRAIRENRLGSEMALAEDALIEQGLYQQVYESYWDAATMRSLGDVTDRKIAELKREHREQMDALRKRRDEQIAKIRKEAELEKEYYRNRAKEKEAKAREKYSKSLDEWRDARERTELRRKCYKIYSELLTLLADPTKKKHVLPELQKAVAEALKVVDMDSVNAAERIERLQIKLKEAKTDAERAKIERRIERIEAASEKVADRLGVLEQAYEALLNSQESIGKFGTEEILQKIEALKEDVGDTTFVHLNRHQLQKLYELFVVTRTQVRNANRLFDDKRNTSVVTKSNKVQVGISEVSKDKNPATDRFSLFRKTEWDNEKPVYAAEKVGSDDFMDLFNGLMRGESKYGVDIKECRDFFAKTAREFGYWKWDQKAITHHESSDGKPFALNLLQKMSLYAYERRGEVALRHIEAGGIAFNEAKKYTKKVDGQKVAYYVRYGDQFPLTRMQVHEITNTLTAEQKQYVETMQAYLSKNMGAKGNEVARVLYGIDLFGEQNYFPIQTVDGKKEGVTASAGNTTMREMGPSQKTQKTATNALRLGSFTDVWANHCHQMSLYHSMVLPLEDFTRVFYYTAGGRSVKNEIQAVYGKEAVEYFYELINQLNGGVRADSAELAYSKWLSLFKKGATFFSLSVVIQQRSAIARAYGEILPQYFIEGNKGKKSRTDTLAEMQKYAGCAVVKEMGSFDVGMGGSSTEWITQREYTGNIEKIKAFYTDSAYRDGKLSRMPAWVDEVTWCDIWRAVKAEVADRNPSLKVGSEEFLKAAGERFSEVIAKTQVYDSVLSRSANMRSKGGLMKMLTAFMAEPTTSINMFGQGIKMMADKKTRWKGIRYCSAVVASLLYNSALVSIVYAMRDDDEDETYLEKYLSSFVSEAADSMNPFTYLPFYKDILSILQGWDVERADMTLFARAKKELLALPTAYKDGDAKKIADGWINTCAALCDFFGIPLRNAYRDVKAGFNFASVLRKYRLDTSAAALGDQIEEGLRQLAPLSDLYWGKDTKTDKLYSAIVNGDEEYLKRLSDGYESDSDLQSAIRKGLRENDTRIQQSAKAYLAGDMEEYTFLMEQIVGEGNFDMVTVKAAVSAEVKGELEEARGEDFPDTDQLTAAYKDGDTDRALEIIDEIVAAKTEENLLKAKAKAYKVGESFEESEAREEAEEKARTSVRSTLTRYWKPLYLAAYESGDTDECERIEDILADSGLYGKAKALRKTLKSWRTED